MILQAVLTSQSMQWTEYLPYTGVIALVILSTVGMTTVALNILRAKGPKPFKNKYPYEKFKSFDHFVQKRPVHPYGVPTLKDKTPENIKRLEETTEAPVLTWENASDIIPSLSVDESKSFVRDPLDRTLSHSSNPSKSVRVAPNSHPS